MFPTFHAVWARDRVCVLCGLYVSLGSLIPLRRHSLLRHSTGKSTLCTLYAHTSVEDHLQSSSCRYSFHKTLSKFSYAPKTRATANLSYTFTRLWAVLLCNLPCPVSASQCHPIIHDLRQRPTFGTHHKTITHHQNITKYKSSPHAILQTTNSSGQRSQ